ncbi:diaminopimelate decarboxylase [Amycolatopsis bartoniae]|uniref:Diaminopimelate decarboxylase n=1 Tax=Amycolatopsis bartoniae TaxID=941986 RepID=A0A8H9J3J9_9PSEU|nr:diaminopimelate decarboxylase [Amycolatopsis bartoniae]MBB2936242.1 diaminopimelate decarboxylase [Amycolatopsis bartoniae]TVT11596.1 diaminopimelate decarboxylase [Amycolatopsis bartoniae]GHF80537.1 diaminopimelate decarboxylase [Amycolatopsis bartoniae]
MAHPAGPRHADVRPHADNAGFPPTTAEEFDRLYPKVWPRNTYRAPDGVVRIAGVDVRELAETYGTPLFVVDEADFKARCAEYAEAFDDPSLVHYAGKAFLCTEVARWVAAQGLSLDVASGGELAIALHAGFPAERITFHGNNKSMDELESAVAAGVGTVVLDSFYEIARLGDVAARHEVVQNVLVRVTVGVEAHTHEFIATAHEDQKFGFSLASGDAAEAVRRVLNAPSLRLIGLHSHIGSQIFDSDGFEVAARRVVGLLAELRKEHGDELIQQLSVVDLGGGFGIAYTDRDNPPPPAQMVTQIREIVRKECEFAGLPVPRIAGEPGRAIAGPGTITLYEVGTIKDVSLGDNLSRRYVSVDGGMSDNIRTALYDAVYDCRLVSRSADEGDGEVGAALSRVVGKHCESGDIVVRDCWLPDSLAPGDLLALAATGAYCYSMASNYNRQPRPAVVAVRNGSARLLLRRETVEDMLNLEVS